MTSRRTRRRDVAPLSCRALTARLPLAGLASPVAGVAACADLERLPRPERRADALGLQLQMTELDIGPSAAQQNAAGYARQAAYHSVLDCLAGR